MKRGGVVLVAVQGDFGKIRPAVIIQSDISSQVAGSITIGLVTSDPQPDMNVRVDINPTPANGLRKPSQIHAYKIRKVIIAKIRGVPGELTGYQS